MSDERYTAEVWTSWGVYQRRKVSETRCTEEAAMAAAFEEHVTSHTYLSRDDEQHSRYFDILAAFGKQKANLKFHEIADLFKQTGIMTPSYSHRDARRAARNYEWDDATQFSVPVFDEWCLEEIEEEHGPEHAEQAYEVFVVHEHEAGQLRCKKCGDWFHNLANHVQRGHEMSFDEYAEETGSDQPKTSEKTKGRISEALLA